MDWHRRLDGETREEVFEWLKAAGCGIWVIDVQPVEGDPRALRITHYDDPPIIRPGSWPREPWAHTGLVLTPEPWPFDESGRRCECLDGDPSAG